MSGQTPPGGADPSMDDILASIRKILNEEEPPQPPAPPAAEAIQLTPEMMVAPPEKLAGIGCEPLKIGPEALASLIRRELPRWAKVVKETGARAD